MALHLTPPSFHHTSTTDTGPSYSAPSAPGVHDTLRANLLPHSSSTTQTPHPSSHHPLESRLARWATTQHELKMSLLRREYGIAEPIKRSMELQIVRAGEWRPAALGLGSARVHEEILLGREMEFGWEEVYTQSDEMMMMGDVGAGMGFHAEMEGRMGMFRW